MGDESASRGLAKQALGMGNNPHYKNNAFDMFMISCVHLWGMAYNYLPSVNYQELIFWFAGLILKQALEIGPLSQISLLVVGCVSF